jgi:hypothetical protein
MELRNKTAGNIGFGKMGADGSRVSTFFFAAAGVTAKVSKL